jgi:hypothetical protein
VKNHPLGPLEFETGIIIFFKLKTLQISIEIGREKKYSKTILIEGSSI